MNTVVVRNSEKDTGAKTVAVYESYRGHRITIYTTVSQLTLQDSKSDFYVHEEFFDQRQTKSFHEPGRFGIMLQYETVAVEFRDGGGGDEYAMRITVLKNV